MAESIMRQEMETWLKKECFNIGHGLMYLFKHVTDIRDTMYTGDIGDVMKKRDSIKYVLRALKLEKVITPEEASLWEKRIRIATDKFAQRPQNTEPYDEMDKLADELIPLTLERTVRCQVPQ